MNEWNIKSILSGIGIVSGGFLYTLIEVLADDENVSIVEFILDSVEKSLIITGAIGVFVIFRRMGAQQDERAKLLKELEVARTEGREWRGRVQTFVNGVGLEIEKQFKIWGLSDAENEVALLMVKGLSHKEIANLRGTAEATVRQQARTVYQKSGLPGKAAFSAYFLEDLLPPSGSNGYSSAIPGGSKQSSATDQLAGIDRSKPPQ